MDDFDSACSSEFHILQNRHQALLASRLQRSRSMPHVNPQKLFLISQHPVQLADGEEDQINQFSTARANNFSYQMKEDSGIESSHHSEQVNAMDIQGDFASAASGMLASEPQSEVEAAAMDEVVEVANAVILMASNNGKPIVINALDDKKLKELRTLKQHYYPEGGWGWLIILITLMVQMISVGFPFGLGMFVLDLPQQSSMSRKMEAEIREHSGMTSHFNIFGILHMTSLLEIFGCICHSKSNLVVFSSNVVSYTEHLHLC